ncbi:MAG: hypothetical protein IK088_07500, partial [Lachnospiraceae bacterium]|nr:hypothetical protein [Lachnospiraceae bacterium]
MKQVRKKFLIEAVSAIAGLLIVLLTIINLVGFTMASEDADRITEMLSEGRGEFPGQPERPRGNGFGPMGPMGPDSPEMQNSVRYFTVSLNENGGGKVVSFNISAVSEKEAVEWAESLKNETTGWTKGTYRYRVYRQKAVTYVTVIDQGRELLSCYRILMISVIGGAMGILISFLILLFVGRKLFAPVEEADRKQKQFIERAEREMKVPLTVIDADVEILERAGGPSEETTSIRRETRKMAALVENMDALRVVETSEGKMKPVSLSLLVEAAVN